MKILKYIIIMILILLGCQLLFQTDSIVLDSKELKIYHEFSDINDVVEMKSKNNQLYFENVYVSCIDNNRNRLLVTLKNPENKRYSVFIQFQELPKDIYDYNHKYINIITESVIQEEDIPILKGIKTYETLKN